MELIVGPDLAYRTMIHFTARHEIICCFREPVIDHYVPEYFQRWRERRYEIFGDSCWTPENGEEEVAIGMMRKFDENCVRRYHPTFYLVIEVRILPLLWEFFSIGKMG